MLVCTLKLKSLSFLPHNVCLDLVFKLVVKLVEPRHLTLKMVIKAAAGHNHWVNETFDGGVIEVFRVLQT